MSSEESSDRDDFQRASAVVQTFSAIAFAGLFIWLISVNGRKFSNIRKEEYQKRLEICVNISIYVAMISAFCNLFQLTEVDNSLLPRQDNYVVDMARPIEWILTCPFMQLALVLLGGEKFPEYRLVLMPALSLVILALGALTLLFAEVTFVWAFFAAAFCFFCVMLHFNRKQIIEVTDGEDSIWSGDSQFRTATLILMVTWLPFPIWFALSPEGTGWIQDIMMIQGGWAFFNITSKFVLIFYIQSMKDEYRRKSMGNQNYLTTTAETSSMKKVSPEEMTPVAFTSPPVTPHFLKVSSTPKLSKKLLVAVHDTLSNIDYHDSDDRLCQLLVEARIFEPADVYALTEEQAKKFELPWEFICFLKHHLGEDPSEADTRTPSRESEMRRVSLPSIAAHWTDRTSVTNLGSKAARDSLLKEIVQSIDASLDAKHKELLESLTGVYKAKNDELLATLTKKQEMHQDDMLAAVNKANATAEKSAQKVDACIDMVNRASCNIVQEQGDQLTALRQQIETQHASLIHHQSDWNQIYADNFAAAEEMRVRKLDAIMYDMQQLKVNMIEIKADTTQDDFRANWKEANSELLREIRHLPSECRRGTESITEMVKSQGSTMRDSCAELRGSLNSVMESTLCTLTTRMDVMMKSLDEHKRSGGGWASSPIGTSHAF